QPSLRPVRDRDDRHALSLQQLFRPRPDEELTRRVVAVWADESRERLLDLGPGLLLLGVAEPHHQVAPGKRPPRVLHGFPEGWKSPQRGNRVDGYLVEASRSVGVL